MKADLQDLLNEQWLRNRNSGKLVWVTKNGNEIPIKDMTDTHLKNTINMLINNDSFRDIECDFDAENFGDR